MFTKALYQKETFFIQEVALLLIFQVSLNVHGLQWQGHIKARKYNQVWCEKIRDYIFEQCRPALVVSKVYHHYQHKLDLDPVSSLIFSHRYTLFYKCNY